MVQLIIQSVLFIQFLYVYLQQKNENIEVLAYSFSYQDEMHYHLSCRHGIGSDLWFFCGFPDSKFGGLCERENERKRMRERRAVILFYKHRKSFESIKISWSTFVTQNIKGFFVIIVLNIRYAVHIWSYSARLDEMIVNMSCNLHNLPLEDLDIVKAEAWT